MSDSGPQANQLSTALTESDSQSDQTVIQERRDALRKHLIEGATGAVVVESFTDLVDERLISRYQNIIQHAGQGAAADLQRSCLVAVGGYGRRELAPYSDIDVMILSQVSEAEAVTNLSKGLFHHLWDLGFQVGHSVRSITEALTLAEADLPAKTALMESRFLVGNATVFQNFQSRFARRNLGRKVPSLYSAKVRRT